MNTDDAYSLLLCQQEIGPEVHASLICFLLFFCLLPIEVFMVVILVWVSFDWFIFRALGRRIASLSG